VRAHLPWFVVFAVLLGSLSGCPLLEPMAPATIADIKPPQVTFRGATLVRAPSQKLLAAYYCPELVNIPIGRELVCSQFFGPRPDPAAMTVAFDLTFHIANPNRIPLPLASVLAAATVFPGGADAKLGAVCLSLCPEGAACSGPSPGACEASSRDIRSMNDFVNNTIPQLLIAGGLALAQGQTPTFVAPQVVASSELEVIARYAFGPQQLLSVLRQLAVQSEGQLRSGNVPTFTIPYRLEGTIWFDAGSLGRIAVGWGPTQGVFALAP
jgi:hypothetical protein